MSLMLLMSLMSPEADFHGFETERIEARVSYNILGMGGLVMVW